VAERVRFVGWCGAEEMEERYAQARIVVVPSVWPEPFGLVGIEAMAAGRPVVGIDRGGIRDWLAHGETGLRVAPQPGALADAVRCLLEERETTARMGAAARERWRALYSPEAHHQVMQEAYEWTLGRE
jgi:glycosyltransferase involved in cell wall biosynthesis